MDALTKLIAQKIIIHKDFPITGIEYYDLSICYENLLPLSIITERKIQELHLSPMSYFIGIESRGFVFGSALAATLNQPFIMIRKQGKLPNPYRTIEVPNEYGVSKLEMAKAEDPNKAFIVDDIVATGNTMQAAIDLANQCGYNVIGAICLKKLDICKIEFSVPLIEVLA